MSDSSKYSAPSLIGRPIQDFVELNRVWEELEKEKYILQLGPHEELPQEELEKGFLACIQEGSLACKMNNGGSQHVLLAIMVTNDLVGLESLFGHKPRQIEYYSREATRLNLFSMSRVRKMMSMSAQLVEFFLEVQSFQLRELASHLQVV
ncbi:MAG: hypothetical protein KDD35_02820, partial [Bdellovibrionales bacterium]|nr:hypothetical protein [Bdellovibrionales bacterium]